MTQCWEPGTPYHQGDVVEYEGQHYKNIQAHTAQSDWAPNITPALWGRTDSHNHGGQQQQQQQQQQYNQPPQNQNPNQVNQYGDDQKQSQHPGSESTEEERKKKWYALDEDRKKQLEIGGGLVAGLGLLGAGYMAYNEHQKSDEEKKAHTWALSNWAQDADQRTKQFYREGPRGPATWILNQGKTMPKDAIVISQEGDWTFYVCRAFHEGSIQIGKASEVFKKGAVIGYAHKEIHLDTYEILIGDMRGLKWVDASGKLNLQALNARPVEGGREANGTPLYIAQAPYKGAVHPGKCSEKLDGAFIPYDDSEKCVKTYRVLCYA